MKKNSKKWPIHYFDLVLVKLEIIKDGPYYLGTSVGIEGTLNMLLNRSQE